MRYDRLLLLLRRAGSQQHLRCLVPESLVSNSTQNPTVIKRQFTMTTKPHHRSSRLSELCTTNRYYSPSSRFLWEIQSASEP